MENKDWFWYFGLGIAGSVIAALLQGNDTIPWVTSAMITVCCKLEREKRRRAND